MTIENKISFDILGAVSLKKLEDDLKSLGQTIDNVNKSSEIYNETGKKVSFVTFESMDQQGNKLTKSLEKASNGWREFETILVEVDKAGNKVTTVLVNVDNKLQTSTRTIETATKKIRDITQAQGLLAENLKELGATADQVFASGFLTDDETIAFLKATAAQIRSLEKQTIDAEEAQLKKKLETSALIKKIRKSELKAVERRRQEGLREAKAILAEELNTFLTHQAKKKKAELETSALIKRIRKDEAAILKQREDEKTQIIQDAISEQIEARNKAFLFQQKLNLDARKQIEEIRKSQLRANKIKDEATRRQAVDLNIAKKKAARAIIGTDFGKTTTKGGRFIAAIQNAKTLTAVQKTLTAAIRASEKASGKFSKTVEKGTKKAKSGIQALTISWQGMVRLLQVQVAHRIFSSMAAGLRESFDEAITFGIKIAEIETISQKLGVTTNSLTREVAALSKEFGSPILETSEGVYQAISNQVIHSTGDFRFLNEAMKLSLTTVSDFSIAVSASSAVLNSYNLGTIEASRINAILFKTVELGRIRLDEISDTMGRVTSLAAPLGISFEEVSAAMSALTIQGVKAERAQTFLINILQKLIRPSDKMKEIFDEWGVSSGEAAIKTFGFNEVMARLEQHAKASGDEMAEFGEIFQRIRATTGAVAFDVDKVNAALEEMKDAGRSASVALDRVKENAGKKLQIELNKVKVFFTQTFGVTSLKVLSTVATMFGGLSNMVKILVDIVIIASSTFVAYKTILIIAGTKTVLLSLKTKSAGTAFASLTRNIWKAIFSFSAFKIAASVGVGVLILLAFHAAAFQSRIAESANKAAESARKIDQNIERISTQKLLEISDSIDKGINDSLTGYRLLLAVLAKENVQSADIFKTAWEKSAEAIEDAFEVALDAVSDRIKKVEDLIKGITDSITAAKKFLEDAARSKEEKEFRKSIEGLSEKDQIRAVAGRGLSLSAAGARDIEAGKDFKSAQAKIAEGEKLQAEALKRLNTLEKKLKKDASDESAIKAQLDLEKLRDKLPIRLLGEPGSKARAKAKKILGLQGAIAAIEAAEAKVTEELKKQAEAKTKLIEIEQAKNKLHELGQKNQEAQLENTKELVVKEEERLKKEEERLRSLEEAEKKLEKQLEKIENFNLDKGSYEDFKNLAEPVTILATEAGLDKDQIGVLQEQIQARADILDKIEATNKALEDQKNISTGIASIEVQLDKLKKDQITAQQNVTDTIKQSGTDSLTNLAALEGFLNSLIVSGKRGLDAEGNATKGQQVLDTIDQAWDKIKELKELEMDIKRLQEVGGRASDDQLARRKSLTDELRQTLKQIEGLSGNITHGRLNAITGRTGFGRDDSGEIKIGDTNLKNITAHLANSSLQIEEAIAKEKETATNLAAVNTSLEKLNTRLDEVREKNPDIAKKMDDAAIKTSTSNGKLTNSLDALNDSIRNRLNLRQPQPRHPASGGIMRLASGGNALAHPGYPSGTDYIPAWLSPGEFVVNPAATKTYLPLLHALNSSTKPLHLASGGQVTNIGDINVTVQGGNTSQQTGRAVAAEIRREMRRGTISKW